MKSDMVPFRIVGNLYFVGSCNPSSHLIDTGDGLILIDTGYEENVRKWHSEGFNVRAWGVSDEEVMKNVYDAGADGMTVNFPDKLAEYIKLK